MEEIVFALTDCSLVHTETKLKVRLVAGEAWWASDPLVKSRPELFGSMPSTIHGQRQVRTVLAPVESARQAPGAKRSVKRS